MQLYIKIFYILIITVITFIVFYILNRNIKEYFSTDTSGDFRSSGGGSNSKRCSPGNDCTYNGKYGYCNWSGICVVGTDTPPPPPPNPNQSTSNPPPGGEETTLHPDCLPNSTNFYQYCTNKGSSYGLQKIIPCDSNNSRAICSNGISVDSESNDLLTPCLNKTDDFNEWCRYYSNYSYNPSLGYNVNSIGAKKVLIGKTGGCYVNGKSDENRARAICTANYTDEVPKLDSANEYIDYNSFTRCMPLNNTDFISECSKALKTDYSSSFADQIGSYDCNPGFGRAKCLYGSDKYIFNNNFQNETFYKNSANDTVKKCTS